MLEHFAAEVTELSPEEGTATVRVMPYGEPIAHRGQQVQFDRGSLAFDRAPVNLDHGQGVLDHIGRVTEFFETDEAAYARLRFSDTQAARETRALLLDEVIGDVSAGVLVDAADEYETDDGILHRAGSLHHVAIVRQGAFGEAGAGSKVLAVHAHDQGGTTVSDEKAASEVAEHDEKPATEDFRAELEELRRLVAETQTPGNVADRVPDLDIADTLKAVIFGGNPDLARQVGADEDLHARNLKRIQDYALAKDTTTVGAGVVPDFAKSEVISIVDANRPINNVLRKTDIGGYGMTIDFPIVATKPSVAVQSAEHDEPDSTAIDINTLAIALGTYAGASDVAVQLLERSFPGYLNVLFEEYAHQFALQTEVVASDALIAGAGGTAVLADLSADAAATIAAVAVRKTAVIAGTRQLPTHLVIGTTRWTELESLADTTKRPLLHYGDGMNSLGANDSPTFMGMQVVVSPDATGTDCVILNAKRGLVVAESGPRFINVDIKGTSLSMQLGIYGYYGTGVAHAAGIQTLTAS